MEVKSCDGLSTGSRVKVTLRLGPEVFLFESGGGVLSQQLVSVKESSMSVLKDFITKHNAPLDVPDEPVEDDGSEDETETIDNPLKKSKK